MNEGSINSRDLARKTNVAKDKIEEGEKELSGVQKTVEANLDVLVHEASMDYLAKLQQDLIKATNPMDIGKVTSIAEQISSHQENMKKYQALARENVGDYIDSSTGEVDMEKFEKELNAFMMETFVIWYGKEGAEKAKISINFVDPSKVDYEALRKNNPSEYGSVTTNKETAGMNHKEKEPKIKILNEELKQFVGKPKSEVAAYVVKTYGDKYHIPGLEYEKYLLENPDKIPAELKDRNWYYFMGSTLRGQHGNAHVPCVHWLGSRLSRDAHWLDSEWHEPERILLLEK